MADAEARGARDVGTFGGAQSNHARLTAGVARMRGLTPHLFYFARRPPSMEGNLLLTELVGAHMHFLGRGLRRPLPVERAGRLARTIVRRHLGPEGYLIPPGGHGWLGAL